MKSLAVNWLGARECPKCGIRPTLRKLRGNYVAYLCSRCGLTSGAAVTEEEALNLWDEDPKPLLSAEMFPS